MSVRLLVLFLVALTACSYGKGDDKDGEKDDKKSTRKKTIEVVPVGVSTVRIGRIARSLTGSGTLRGAREVDVVSQSDGLVVDKPCDVGSRVTKGQVLASLDGRGRLNALKESRLKLVAAQGKLVLSEIALEEQEQAIERANLKEKDAGLSLDKSKLGWAEAKRALRAKLQLPKGTFSQDELERARLAEQQAAKEVSRAELAVTQAKLDTQSSAIKKRELTARVADSKREIEESKLQLAKAQLEYDKTKVTAPIAGVVTECTIELGHRVGAATVCYKIVDARYFYLDLRMPEAELQVLRAGQPVLLTSALVSMPILGRLERIDPAVDPATGTAGVRIRVPYLPGGSQAGGLLTMSQLVAAARLKRGMFVRARIQVEVHSQAKLVTPEALVFENQRSYVYSVGDGKARRIPVALGFSRESVVEIVTDALKAGDPVIIKGQRMIQHASPVTVVEREGVPVEAPEPAKSAASTPAGSGSGS